jgi:hypothetical protein
MTIRFAVTVFLGLLGSTTLRAQGTPASGAGRGRGGRGGIMAHNPANDNKTYDKRDLSGIWSRNGTPGGYGGGGTCRDCGDRGFRSRLGSQAYRASNWSLYLLSAGLLCALALSSEVPAGSAHTHVKREQRVHARISEKADCIPACPHKSEFAAVTPRYEKAADQDHAAHAIHLTYAAQLKNDLCFAPLEHNAEQ